VLTSGRGELSSSGHLEVSVTGLVLDPNDPTVISRGLAGTNPFDHFEAIVSCRSVDSTGAPSVVNLITSLFPATTGSAVNGGGNAKMEAKVNLPHPCIAPIVFVASPAGAWFASTGN
jgi:hypothetical protein